MSPGGPMATASSSTTSEDPTAAPNPEAGTSIASTPDAARRRTSPPASPSASTASPPTSPRRRSASPNSSGQPITHTEASSGTGNAGSAGVGSAWMSATARHARSEEPTTALQSTKHTSNAGLGVKKKTN